jgi:tetratricopeptide (TPR) repeat protein
VRRLGAALGLLLAACAAERPSSGALYRQGRAALQRGDLVAARAAIDEGRRQARLPQDGPWLRAHQVLEAELLVSQRRNHEALARLKDLDAWPETSTELRTRALMTRGYAWCLLSEGPSSARNADADLGEAERLAAQLGVEELQGEVLVRRGSCATVQGDSVAAEARLLAALKIARRAHVPSVEAHAMGGLGLLHLRAGRFDQATDWLYKTSALATAHRMDSIVAKAVGNLGWCYLQLGDLERSLAYLTQAVALAEKQGSPGGDLRMFLTVLGNVHFRQGAYGQARTAWERALAIGRDLDDERAISQTLGSLGIVALEEGRYDEAESHAEEALRLEQKLGDLADQEENRLTLGRIWAARGDLARAQALYQGVIRSPHTASAILWEAHVYLAKAHMASGQTGAAETEFRRAFDVMERSRLRLNQPEHKISFFSSLTRFREDYVDLLMNAGKVTEALAVADRCRARSLRDLLRENATVVPLARPEEIARSQNATLLFYWTGPKRSFVWRVTRDDVEVRELPGEETLAQRVRAYQDRILRSRDPLAEGDEDGLWLYRTLVGSGGEGPRVIVVPDGPLHELNFETLPVASPVPHYWIEDVTVARAPALGLLHDGGDGLPRPERGARTILLIGDPVSPSPDFAPLPHAALEMRRIAEQFEPTARVLHTGARAVPEVYRASLPERFTYIHFAAHAIPNFEQPLESAVVLSAQGEAFKLYARELASIPVRADLVTLSACYGAGSRHYAGEGFVGLAWAFLGSGARNVVAGLWNIEETSTAELMEELYRGLRRGLAPPEALRAAKLGLLRSSGAYRKPYYWGPFVTYTRQWGTSAAHPAR